MAEQHNPGAGYPNPWKGTLRIVGTDMNGKPAEIIVPKPAPPLYFWLGADAYPEWPVISRIELPR